MSSHSFYPLYDGKKMSPVLFLFLFLSNQIVFFIYVLFNKSINFFLYLSFINLFIIICPPPFVIRRPHPSFPHFTVPLLNLRLTLHRSMGHFLALHFGV